MLGPSTTTVDQVLMNVFATTVEVVWYRTLKTFLEHLGKLVWNTKCRLDRSPRYLAVLHATKEANEFGTPFLHFEPVMDQQEDGSISLLGVRPVAEMLGMFPLVSRFNHDCDASARIFAHGDINLQRGLMAQEVVRRFQEQGTFSGFTKEVEAGLMTVVALRDIQAGEEITLDYGTPEGLAAKPREVREVYFGRGGVCLCETCRGDAVMGGMGGKEDGDVGGKEDGVGGKEDAVGRKEGGGGQPQQK